MGGGEAPSELLQFHSIDVPCRVCPGRNFGENTTWLSIATLLAVFDISKPLDVHGKEIDQVPDFVNRAGVMQVDTAIRLSKKLTP